MFLAGITAGIAAGIALALPVRLMTSLRRRGIAAVTGLLVLVPLTTACGGATGAEDLFQDEGRATSSSAPAPGTRSPMTATPAPGTPAPGTEPPGTPARSSATCAIANVPATRGSMCSRPVTVDSFAVVRASCYVDTEIGHGAEGTLQTPCDGDGEAMIVFGSMTFRGSIVSGRIDVCAGTEFPWQDGCTWTSAQRVSGALSDGVLTFGYGEAPKAGEEGCATACSATGSLRVR